MYDCKSVGFTESDRLSTARKLCLNTVDVCLNFSQIKFLKSPSIV